MTHKSRLKLIHYLLLLGLFLGGGLTLLLVHVSLIKWIVLSGLSAIYLIWGVWFHYEEHTLNRVVILEYIALLSLVLVVLIFIS